MVRSWGNYVQKSASMQSDGLLRRTFCTILVGVDNQVKDNGKFGIYASF